ncbi:2,3-diaminopropionate biosynthesis protein SbnB [Kitasatospora atroaurantiaca]|uniref:Ornithine cyclodeaminase n=1 Tax=Kitasatospora atroaurantiaca TaxID=285545 RepID=A0A561EID8_9ACTN|nr:2,3-diaminopropionate biosynthesis protein SbnB [Kitasatospora atroaurantiaca]TWE15386.1 ornithine cyclodeaminase [Kitasatospora atroaurantiaca]
MGEHTTTRPPVFSVVPGAAVHRSLEGRRAEILDLVENAYRLHGAGHTVNPPSYFLRFPDRPASRIIALPASVGGEVGVDGIKWISSFPTNLELGIPRASAMLVLNDRVTGYPFACLEGSIISAVRTAASAAVAARALTAERGAPRRIGFIGTGLIARYLHTYLSELGWDVEEFGVFDLSEEYARSFAGQVLGADRGTAVRVHSSAEELIRSSDLVVFATTAATPHITDPDWFSHHPVVLHVSLRDLSTEIILDSVNVVDDVDHVLQANTSVHLTEQRTGNREFLHATLDDVLTGRFTAPADRTVVFSPFGLGLLDLVVGANVHRWATAAGDATTIDGFFHDLDRYESAGAR